MLESDKSECKVSDKFSNFAVTPRVGVWIEIKGNKRGEDTFYYVKDGVLYWGKEKKAGKEEVHG